MIVERATRTARCAIAATALGAAALIGTSINAQDAGPEPLVEVEPGLYEGDTVVAVTDVQYARVPGPDGAMRPLLFDAVFPADAAEPLPIVVYLHGGAWQRGSRRDGYPVIGPLARSGAFAVTIDYRLLPDQYPAPLDDVYTLLRFLTEQAETLHLDPNRVVLIGTTAGGHLATLAALAANAELEDGAPARPRVSGAIALSGSTDLADPAFGAVAQRIIDAWAADQRESASPVSHVDADDPALLLVHAADDPIVPASQAHRLAERMKAAGARARVLIVEGEAHGVPLDACRDDVLAFMAECFADPPPETP